MIFLGDFASPSENLISNINITDEHFINEPKILNLESVITDNIDLQKKKTSGIALHSTSNIYNILNGLNVTAVSLANNHVFDYCTSISKLKKELKFKNISSFGAGENINDAKQIFGFKENDTDFIVIAFGWNVIGCRKATTYNKGVNPLNYNYVIDEIKQLIQIKTNSKIIVSFHWNYEFEFYPQPKDRNLAHDLIDLGVEMIIGHHPHIVGSIEVYKNKAIFYSLGNFFIHETNYNGHILNYKSKADIGLGVEYNSDFKRIKLYWFKKKSNEILSIDKIETLEALIKKENHFTETQNKSKSEYSLFFKKNRRKKFLLPIYKSNTRLNIIYDLFVLLRNYTINKMVKYNIK